MKQKADTAKQFLIGRESEMRKRSAIQILRKIRAYLTHA